MIASFTQNDARMRPKSNILPDTVATYMKYSISLLKITYTSNLKNAPSNKKKLNT
jgi:hypothetical protein